MRQLTRFTIIPLVGALLCFGAVRVLTSSAQGWPWAPLLRHLTPLANVPSRDYLIEAYENYCKGGATSCNQNQIEFAGVAALSPTLWPNETPRDTAVECSLAPYTDPVTGDLIVVTKQAYTGQDMGAPYYSDPGTIGGWGQVQFNATEATTNAQSKLLLWIHDNVTGDSASIQGTQYTNNVTDLLSQPSGFTISMYGPIQLLDLTTDKFVGTGAPTSISRSTGNPPITGEGLEYPFFEGTIANNGA